MPNTVYATPKEGIPILNGREIGFFYVEPDDEDKYPLVKGLTIDAVVRKAVEVIPEGHIACVGRLG